MDTSQRHHHALASLFSCLICVVAFVTSCAGSETGDRPPEPPAPVTPSPAPESVPPVEPAETPRPPGACPGPEGRVLRTLVVGNSQIYFWNLPRILSELSDTAAPGCPRIRAEGFTRGGQTLRNLWRDGDSLGRDLPTVIRDGDWDVVVIAESIGLVESEPPHHDFLEHANLIIDAARDAGANPVLYATPYPDQDGHAFFREMAEPQLALGAARAVPVAAGGLAWLRVWEELPEIDLHHPDHEHPGYNGSVVSAMTIYAVLTHASPLPLVPRRGGTCEDRPGQPVPCPPISDAELDVFRRAAWAEARATGLR